VAWASERRHLSLSFKSYTAEGGSPKTGGAALCVAPTKREWQLRVFSGLNLMVLAVVHT